MPLPDDLKNYRAPREEDDDALEVVTWTLVGAAVLVGAILMLHMGGPL